MSEQPTEAKTEKKVTHVDDFIDSPWSLKDPKKFANISERYAKFFLDFARRPAAFHSMCNAFFVQKLFCTFRGERYRVTGASRLGDVWLTKNFEQESGYQLRVDLDDCSLWWWTVKEPTESQMETALRRERQGKPLNVIPDADDE